jgi:transposase
MTAGRPTKYTPTMRAGILKALRAGNTRTNAAESMGIDRNTLARWIDEDDAFCRAVKDAESVAEQEAVDAIKSQFGQQWTAAAWYLERKKPDDWGKRERMDVTSGGQPISFTLQIGQSDDADRDSE